MARPTKVEISEKEISFLYTEKLLTDEKIADYFHCSKQKIYLLRKKLGIHRLTRTDRNSKRVVITERQKEILRGSLLGDASVTANGEFEITHGTKQKAYLFWLYENLIPYFEKPKPNRTDWRIRAHSHYFGKDLRKEYYLNDKKIVTTSVLEKLTSLSLAVWFLDDGQLLPNNYQSRFCTCCFSAEENKVIVDFLQRKWGIVAQYKKFYGYNFVMMNTDGTARLKEIISPYVPACMRYKVGEL